MLLATGVGLTALSVKIFGASKEAIDMRSAEATKAKKHNLDHCERCAIVWLACWAFPTENDFIAWFVVKKTVYVKLFVHK